MLRVEPAQEHRLLAIIVNLDDRLREARERGWHGEVDGLSVSIEAARQKLAHMRKLSRTTTADLPTPRRGRPDRH